MYFFNSWFVLNGKNLPLFKSNINSNIIRSRNRRNKENNNLRNFRSSPNTIFKNLLLKKNILINKEKILNSDSNKDKVLNKNLKKNYNINIPILFLFFPPTLSLLH